MPLPTVVWSTYRGNTDGERRGGEPTGKVRRTAVRCCRLSKTGAAVTQAIITQFLSGFSIVAILILVSLGLAIIFGVAGVINMAHGEFIMVGAYTAAVVGELGGNTFIAIPMAFVIVGLLGLIVERGIIQWIYDRPLETLLATWGSASRSRCSSS